LKKELDLLTPFSVSVLAKKITNRVFKRWIKEGTGMPEILEDELKKYMKGYVNGGGKYVKS